MCLNMFAPEITKKQKEEIKNPESGKKTLRMLLEKINPNLDFEHVFSGKIDFPVDHEEIKEKREFILSLIHGSSEPVLPLMQKIKNHFTKQEQEDRKNLIDELNFIRISIEGTIPETIKPVELTIDNPGVSEKQANPNVLNKYILPPVSGSEKIVKAHISTIQNWREWKNNNGSNKSAKQFRKNPAQAMLKDLMEEIEIMRNKKNNLESQIGNLAKQYMELNNKQHQLPGEITKIKEQKILIEKEVFELNNQKQTLELDIMVLKGEKKILENSLINLRSKLSELKNEVSSLKELKYTLDYQLTTFQSLQDSDPGKVKKITEKVAEIKAKNELISQKENELTGITAKISFKKSEITDNHIKIVEKEKVYNPLSFQIQIKQQEHNNQIQSVITKETELLGLSSAIISKNSDISVKQSEIDTLDIEIKKANNAPDLVKLKEFVLKYEDKNTTPYEKAKIKYELGIIAKIENINTKVILDGPWSAKIYTLIRESLKTADEIMSEKNNIDQIPTGCFFEKSVLALGIELMAYKNIKIIRNDKKITALEKQIVEIQNLKSKIEKKLNGSPVITEDQKKIFEKHINNLKQLEIKTEIKIIKKSPEILKKEILKAINLNPSTKPLIENDKIQAREKVAATKLLKNIFKIDSDIISNANDRLKEATVKQLDKKLRVFA